MKTARQALTDIAALCDFRSGRAGAVPVIDLRAVLSDVEPEPAVVWDRDAARDVLIARYFPNQGSHVEATLDALEGCVRPAPAQTIDRDAVAQVVYPQAFTLGGVRDVDGEWVTQESVAFAYAAADRILALLRPVDGVVLTREECEHAADWHDYIVDQGGEMPSEEIDLALRLRAGAAT